MSKGVVLFAQNNHTIDYVKQAVFCAKKIKKHLNLPVAIATDNVSWLLENYPYYTNYIDHIIELEWKECKQKRIFHDGTMSNRDLEWRNHERGSIYDITPFDETIVMDTDFIIGNDIFLNAFLTDQDFLIHRNDFSFSIAIHLMNGHQRTSWPHPMPGKLWFTTDVDVLVKMEEERYLFLLDKKDWKGHYDVSSIENVNIHIMNKFSLDRAINEVLTNE
jgi:hypothetical protein